MKSLAGHVQLATHVLYMARDLALQLLFQIIIGDGEGNRFGRRFFINDAIECLLEGEEIRCCLGSGLDLPQPASDTIKTLAGQYAKGGTEGLANPQVFEMSDVRAAGGLADLKAVGEPAKLLQETKERMFAA